LPTPHSPFSIRQEELGDAEAVLEVNELAFGGPAESGIVKALRANGKVVLSLVAVVQGVVVGHVMFSPVRIDPSPPGLYALQLSPLAVVPEEQGRGIGSALVREGLRASKKAGCDAVFLLGDPAYYGRFGFKPASAFGIRYDRPLRTPDAFQAAELTPDALATVSGVLIEAEEFRLAE
jgi:putative acetyltransferase